MSTEKFIFLPVVASASIDQEQKVTKRHLHPDFRRQIVAFLTFMQENNVCRQRQSLFQSLKTTALSVLIVFVFFFFGGGGGGGLEL